MMHRALIGMFLLFAAGVAFAESPVVTGLVVDNEDDREDGAPVRLALSRRGSDELDRADTKDGLYTLKTGELLSDITLIVQYVGTDGRKAKPVEVHMEQTARAKQADTMTLRDPPDEGASNAEVASFAAAYVLDVAVTSWLDDDKSHSKRLKEQVTYETALVFSRGRSKDEADQLMRMFTENLFGTNKQAATRWLDAGLGGSVSYLSDTKETLDLAYSPGGIVDEYQDIVEHDKSTPRDPAKIRFVWERLNATNAFESTHWKPGPEGKALIDSLIPLWKGANPPPDDSLLLKYAEENKDGRRLGAATLLLGVTDDEKLVEELTSFRDRLGSEAIKSIMK